MAFRRSKKEADISSGGGGSSILTRRQRISDKTEIDDRSLPDTGGGGHSEAQPSPLSAARSVSFAVLAVASQSEIISELEQLPDDSHTKGSIRTMKER